MKAVVGAFNQEKALVGAFSVIVQPVVEPMDRFTALPRTLRRDEERLLHGVSEIFPDTAAVISLIIIVTVFMYKIISTRKTRKTSSNTPIPVKSASPSSASSFIIGSRYKLYLLPYYLNYYTFLDHKVILYHNMVLAIISCIFTRNREERRRVNLKTSNIRFEGGRVLGGVGARPRGGRGPGPEAGGEAGQRGGHQTSLASGGRPPGGARPPLRPWPRSRRTRGHSCQLTADSLGKLQPPDLETA